MPGPASKVTMKLLTIAIGIPVGMGMRKLTERAFAATRPASDGRDPQDAGVDWSDALIWAAISGVGVAVTELLARKGAEETYRLITGHTPPPQRPSKRQKKLAKSQKKQTADHPALSAS